MLGQCWQVSRVPLIASKCSVTADSVLLQRIEAETRETSESL